MGTRRKGGPCRIKALGCFVIASVICQTLGQTLVTLLPPGDEIPAAGHLPQPQ